MIPSASTSHLVQYAGLIGNITIKDPDAVKHIKITDVSTKCVLYDEDVFVDSKVQWCLSGYADSDTRIVYKSVKPKEREHELVLVIDMNHRLEIGSLNFLADKILRLTVEYKFQRTEKQNQTSFYEIIIE